MIALEFVACYIGCVKQRAEERTYTEYADEFIATDRKTGRVLAHSPSIRRLHEQLRRKQIDFSRMIVEKIPPKGVVCIY